MLLTKSTAVAKKDVPTAYSLCLQHIAYTVPVAVLTSSRSSKINDFSFHVKKAYEISY